MHISVSKFSTIFNKLQACGVTSTEHFLGPSRKNFSFFIFLQKLFFGQRVCRSDMKHLMQYLQKKITYMDSLLKNTKIQKEKSTELESGWGIYRWFKISYVIDFFFLMTTGGRQLSYHFLKFLVKNFRKRIVDLRSPWKIAQFQKKLVESEFGCGRYGWFKISCILRTFVTTKKLQWEYEIL